MRDRFPSARLWQGESAQVDKTPNNIYSYDMTTKMKIMKTDASGVVHDPSGLLGALTTASTWREADASLTTMMLTYNKQPYPPAQDKEDFLDLVEDYADAAHTSPYLIGVAIKYAINLYNRTN